MSDDLRIETLGHDSLAVSQERTENGTGVTRGTLQNESQESEMQGHLPEGWLRGTHHLLCAVADQPDTNKHLPECQLATGVYDDRSDCICDELRACEQRVLGLRLDDLHIKSFNAALDAAREALTEALNALPIKWTSDELFPAVLTIHQVFDSLKEKP